jgi:putative transposase
LVIILLRAQSTSSLLRHRLLHYITTSCYKRRAWFAAAANCDLFVEVLEQVRRRYHFVVVGYVVMPEHVHLLLSEPERSNPSVVMQAIKQGFARRLLGRLRSGRDLRQVDLCDVQLDPKHVWQRRFYDFVVRTYEKRQEKLHYIHQNPVRASLVLEPWLWRWSSAPHYLRGESGPVLVNELVVAEMKIRPVP